MHGKYDRSIAPRLFLTALHAAAVSLVGWLLLGGGLEVLRAKLGTDWGLASPARRWLLFGGALVYFLRVIVTTFYLLKRNVGWAETLLISLWITAIDVLFAVLGGFNARAIGPVAAFGLILYILGSSVNTHSELQRKRWKDRPENRGRLFTGGLFRHAMHVNYFGDELLFIGYALLTGRAWALLVPFAMLAGFLFFNIPELDNHLRKHYGTEFDEYDRRTPKFVPFVY
jgi:protein-S-isoprenylcysteine O-methyltransferase Ste14